MASFRTLMLPQGGERRRAGIEAVDEAGLLAGDLTVEYSTLDYNDLMIL